MKADFTEAAKLYNLHRIPALVYDTEGAFGYAAFHADTWTIAYGDYLAVDTEERMHDRLTALGLHLNKDDAIRFALAHELYHAEQYEREPEAIHEDEEKLHDEEELEDIQAMLGLDDGSLASEAHDKDPYEIEADKQGAKAYKLIRIQS